MDELINQEFKMRPKGNRTNRSQKEIKRIEHGSLKKDEKKYCCSRRIEHGSLEYDVKCF